MSLFRQAIATLCLATAIGSAAAVQPAFEALARGEAALARGELGVAQAALEQAAGMAHEPEIETALTRALMQAGSYRAALSFAAHTAGAHLESSSAAALYAWLLHIGGQASAAKSMLAAASSRWPDAAEIALVRAGIADHASMARAETPAIGVPLAPYAQGVKVEPGARVIGSATLIGDGGAALASLAGLDGDRHTRIWLRDGLGRTRSAVVERRDASLGLALLRVNEGFDGAGTPRWAPSDPFPGSPAYAVGYAAGGSAAPQWPAMQLGFLGRPVPGGSRRQLGFTITPGSSGAPLLDTAGRMVGVVASVADGQAQFVSLSQLRASFAPEFPAPEGATGTGRVGLDEVYERTMRLTLQVIVLPPNPAN